MKYFSTFLALVLIFSITSCSSPAKNNKNEQKTTSIPLMESTEKIIEETTEEENITQVASTTKKEETTKKTDAKPLETTTQKTTNNSIPTTANPQTTPSSSKKLPNYTPEAEVVTLFNKINKYREEKGLNKLVLDPELCKMAYVRADEQNTLKGHIRPDNTKYYSILDQYNYDYTGCGENIAFVGEISADRAFNLWKNSSTHNQNMLEPRWTKSGIAVHKYIDGTYSIVQIFVA